MGDKIDLTVKEGLVLEGGGVLGISYVGAIKELYKNGLKCRHFIGSSVGSLFALLLSINIDLGFLEEYVLELNINDLIDNPNIFVGTYRLCYNYGWHSTLKFRSAIEKVVTKITGKKDMTFGEVLSICGNHLAITTYSMKKGGTEIYDPIVSPNESIVDACIHSCTVPFFFETDGHLDGGLKNNYPINYMDKLVGSHKTLGLTLHQDEKCMPYPKGIYEFIKYVAEVILNQAMKLHVDDSDKHHTIQIDIDPKISFLDFNIGVEQKKELIQQGSTTILKYV
jgi:NTE family protein